MTQGRSKARKARAPAKAAPAGRETPDIGQLRARLEEAEQTLAAIRLGNITAQKQAERRLVLERAVSAGLSQANTPDEAVGSVLAAIGEHLQAACGELWAVDLQTESLAYLRSWEGGSTVLSDAGRARRRRRFSRGEGFIGKIWDTAKATLTTDVATDVVLSDSPFTGAPLAAAFGFPVAMGGRVLGCAIFFCPAAPRIDQTMLDVLAHVGHQVAQFLEHKRVEDEMLRQQDAMRALSTPVLKVRERLLILPLIGVIDAARAKQLTDQLLAAIRANRARALVIDITGVAAINADVANHLVRTVQAAKLLGATTILCGISRAIAHTLSTIHFDTSLIQTVGDLQSGIEEALYMLGLEVAPIEKRTPAKVLRTEDGLEERAETAMRASTGADGGESEEPPEWPAEEKGSRGQVRGSS